MKYFFMCIALVAAGCSSGYDTVIECYSTVQFRKFVTPSFSSYRMNVRAQTGSRLDFYIQMPYRNVRFEKSVSGFAASYSMTFIFRNASKEIVSTKEIDRPLSVRTYEESVSPKYDFHLQSFVLAPGFYSVEISAVDGLSKLRSRTIDTVTIRDFTVHGNFTSSVLFLEGLTVDENGIALRPILPATISLLSDSIGIYQELYHLTTGDTVLVKERYFIPTGRRTGNDYFSYQSPPYKLSSDQCSYATDSMYFSSDSTVVPAGGGTIQLFQFYPLPRVGGSTMERMVILKRGSMTDTAQMTTEVFRRDPLYRFTLSPEEVKNAMRYIMREKEYDSLAAAGSDELSAQIDRFWAGRGGTARQVQFERRILEANKLFTTCIDGSQTAMGIVYIVAGAPDYIDCRGSYLETWYYTIGERAYAVPFRRESESSRTFELTPFSVNDAVWQLFIDRWRRNK